MAEGSEERFRSLVQDASGILLVTNADGIVSYVSPAIEPVLGYRPEDVVGKDTLTLVHPDDVGRVGDAMAEALGNPGTPSSIEIRLGHRDGSWRHVESSCTSRLDDPAVGGLVFDSREVTERKRADVVPKDSEARSRSFVEQAGDALLAYDLEGRFVDVNRQACESLGYTREELLTLSVADVAENPEPGALAGLWECTLSDGPVTLDGVHRRKDGTSFPVEVRISPLTVGGRRLMLALARDVTERRLAESKLREAEAKYRTLVEHIPAITYIEALDQGEEVKHEILYVSPQIEELLGYSREELTSNPNLWEELLHPEDRAWVMAEDARTERTGALFSAEYRVIARDGRAVYIRDDAMLVRDASGQPRFWQGVMYDTTERKEAEARFREAEERYRAVVEQIPAVIYIRDAADSNAVTYVSPQMKTMLGYELEDWTSDPECWVKTLHPADRKRVLTENRRANEKGEPFKMEYRRFAEDGRVVWIRDEATLVRDGQGEPWYWLGVQVDVTERRRAEEALEESELRLRTVITHMPVVLFALDYAGVFKLSEGKGLDALGLKPGEAVGRSVSEIHGDKPEILGDVDRALAGEEIRAVRRIGSRRFEIWYSPLRTSGEEVIGVIGVAVDVTERERAEEALRQSEERFRKLSGAAFEGIVIHDGGRVLEANEAYAAMHGYEVSEILGRSTLEWVAPEYRDLVRRNILSGYEETYESVEVRKDGTRIDVEVRGRQLTYRGRTVRVTAVRDVTERKEAEARLKETERRLSTLLSDTPAMVYRCLNEPDWPEEYVSDYAVELTGYPAAAFMENPTLFGTLISEKDKQRIWDEVQEAVGRGERFRLHYAIHHKDGSLRFVEELGQGVYDESGGVVAVEGLIYDVTQRKRAEEALRESEERYRTLVEQIPAVTYVDPVDDPDTSLYTSPQIEEMLGYTSHEWTENRLWPTRLHPDDRERVLAADERFEAGGKAFDEEYRLIHKDGSVVWVHEEAVLVTGEADEPLYWQGILTDVTERKRAEEALRESEERHRRQARELDLLHQVRTALAQELELPTVFRTVVETIARTFGYTLVSAYLLQGETLVLQHQVGYERVLERILPITRGIMGRAVRSRRAVLLADVRSDPEFLDAIEDLTSEVCVPLFDEGRVVGTLNVESTNGVELTENDLRLMTALAEHVNVAINRAGLYTRVRESEERFRSLIQNASDIITLLEADGTIRYQSPSAEQLLGYHPEELIGKNAFDYVHPEDLERVMVAFAEGLQDPGSRPTEEYRCRHKDGSWRFLESIGSNLLDDTKIGSFVVNSRDITERKRVDEARARLARQAELRADVSAALSEGAALREMLQRCTEAVVEKLGAAFARIWLFNQAENVLELQASAGMYTHTDGPHGCVPVGEFEIGLIAHERRPHLANDVGTDPHIDDKEWARREGMVAFAGYPLLVEDRLVGVLALFARETLAEDTTEALAQVADVIAQGIERKRAEEASRRSEKSLAEAQWIAHIGNWEYEVEEDRANWSDEMYRIFDLSPEEFTPKYRAFLKLVHPDDKELVRRAVREALYGGRRGGIEYRIVRPNGEVRYVHSEYELPREEPGGTRRLIGTVHDTTERKQAEERLREANRRLAELAVLKADFTAMVAHELDTPLAVIRGYVDMLATGELEPAEQSQAFDKIQSETDLLEALISDVRTAAYVERETFTIDPQPVKVGTLLKDAAAFVETLPGDHPLVVANDSGEQELWADPYRIGQVLRNLLSNAAKYSPNGAPIELRAISGEKPQRVRIEVEDQGAGVNPEDAGRIFEKFGRGRDKSGRKVAGVGLGLYLSRRLLQAHGSELRMVSAPGGGSVFGFELEITR